MIQSVTIPVDAEITHAQFAQTLADTPELTDEINTTVTIEVLTDRDRQAVKVREHGNDGMELVEERDESGEWTVYQEGTSPVGRIVQQQADAFFGTHNYTCTFYEDHRMSRTIITP